MQHVAQTFRRHTRKAVSLSARGRTCSGRRCGLGGHDLRLLTSRRVAPKPPALREVPRALEWACGSPRLAPELHSMTCGEERRRAVHRIWTVLTHLRPPNASAAGACFIIPCGIPYVADVPIVTWASFLRLRKAVLGGVVFRRNMLCPESSHHHNTPGRWQVMQACGARP